MNFKSDNLSTRQLGEQEAIPYDLLLLADESKAMIDRYAKDGEIYVLKENSRLIALYVLQVLDEKRAEIKNIAVDNGYQGKGIGTFLLREATSRAKARGFTTLLIGTANGSIKQLYLYQKEGFEITSIKMNFFVDHYPEPIFENGILCKHMLMLEKQL
jgi:aminoglycoside 6'-N-acetyltransferase I